MSKIIPLILILASSLFFIFKNKNPEKTIEIKLGDKTFNLEIAQTISQRTKGLSDRESLCQNCGMIFIYQKEGIYPFWMKNTRIPLDIIWLDKNGKIVDIKIGQPESLSILSNSTPAQYIVETNPNATGLSVDDIIKLPNEIN
jgi:hypothetical protein